MGIAADSLFSALMSWVRALVNALWALFSADRTTALEFLGKNWMAIAAVIIVCGLVIDWLVWLIRWQPYHLWARRLRRLLRLDEEMDEEPRKEKAKAHAAVMPQSRYARPTAQEDDGPEMFLHDMNYDMDYDMNHDVNHDMDEYMDEYIDEYGNEYENEYGNEYMDADEYGGQPDGRDEPVYADESWQRMQEEARLRAEAEQAERERREWEAREAERARREREAYEAEQARLARAAYEAEQARLAQEAYEAEQARLAQEEYARQMEEYERQRAQYERDLAEYERQKAEYEAQLAAQSAYQAAEEGAARRRRTTAAAETDERQHTQTMERPAKPGTKKTAPGKAKASQGKPAKAAHAKPAPAKKPDKAEKQEKNHALLSRVAKLIEPEEEELISRPTLPPRVDMNDAFRTAKLPVVTEKRGGRRKK